jgi:homoaconitase
MIIARSFARIHETNLKARRSPHFRLHSLTATQKQGVLPLWFADKADYTRIGAGDALETVGLAALLDGDAAAPLALRVTPRAGGAPFDVPVTHTLSGDQLKWLRAGSALNHIRAQMADA